MMKSFVCSLLLISLGCLRASPLSTSTASRGRKSHGRSRNNSNRGDRPHRSLDVVESTLLTSASLDFGGDHEAFQTAAEWDEARPKAVRDRDGGQGVVRAPYFACAEHSQGREASSRLRLFLSHEAVQTASYSRSHGACFFVTASNKEAESMLADPELFALVSVVRFPSALKIAPGVLVHAHATVNEATSLRLTTTHGSPMLVGRVDGLIVQLSPGTLPSSAAESDAFIEAVRSEFLSGSLDLFATNLWSDPAMGEWDHLATAGGALRAREWNRAAAVVHEMSTLAQITPGDVCSWGDVTVHHVADDVLITSGG